MVVTFERQALLKKLLEPINRITESCVLTINKDYCYTLATSPDGGIILYSKLNCSSKTVTDEFHINIPNVRKLIQVFECIQDSFVDLDIQSNHIAYSSPKIKFKYFLLDEGIIEVPPIKVEKIEALSFDCNFKLNEKKLAEISRGRNFSAETEKIYFYTKDKEVFAELADQTIQNTDSITFQVADSFTGSELKQLLPLNADIIRLISGLKASDVKVHVNTTNKVLLFEITSPEHTIKFIISSLVK